MNNFINIILIVYSILGALICVGFYKNIQKQKKQSNEISDSISLSDLIVLIPFRDEEARIISLINSINNLTSYPKIFLFIDDHSSDNSSSIIQQINNTINYEIIHLPQYLSGKKSAIRYGIEHMKSEYYITWDADIKVNRFYFNEIEKLLKIDLYILPVKMKGNNIKEQYFESDFAIANAINTSVNGWYRPFLANGANLLFKKKSFDEIDSFKDHAHISSGDDLFLLKDFRIHQKRIQLISSEILTVETESPKNWKDFIQQRLRWIGKSTQIGDMLSNCLAILSLIFNMTFWLVFLYFLIEARFFDLFYSIVLKSCIDLLVYFYYFNLLNQLKTWFMLPFFSLIQPLYLFVLTICYRMNVKWKGRNIYVK